VLCFTAPPEIYILAFAAGQPLPLLYRVDSEQVVEVKSRGARTSILSGPLPGKEQAQVVDVRHDAGFVYAALEQQPDGKPVVALWNYSCAARQPAVPGGQSQA
jgi:hypothetical protein